MFLDDFHSHYYRDRFVSITRDDFFTSNILARIKIGGGSYQVLYENNEDGIERSRKYSQPISLRKMRIKLLNLHGKLAEINNMDYSLVFEVVQRFRRLKLCKYINFCEKYKILIEVIMSSQRNDQLNAGWKAFSYFVVPLGMTPT